jgi:predicted DNA-binding protein YlxM (UPF0122 family)
MVQTQAVEEPNNPPDRIRKIDISEAFKLRFKNNLSFQAIADHFGCTKQSVFDALAPFSKLINNSMDTSVYDQNRAGILTSLEFEMVKQMSDPSKLKSASLNNLAYSISQINNMIRLEKGQPTAITEHLDGDLSGMIDQLCNVKSAGSGSTIDVTPSTSSPGSAVAQDDVLSSLLPAPDETLKHQSAEPVQSTMPAGDRSTCGDLDPINSANQPAKRGKRGKYAPRTTTKSATNSRKQNAGNITASLNSKADETKQGTNSAPAADTLSSQTKEWYE